MQQLISLKQSDVKIFWTNHQPKYMQVFFNKVLTTDYHGYTARNFDEMTIQTSTA